MVSDDSVLVSYSVVSMANLILLVAADRVALTFLCLDRVVLGVLGERLSLEGQGRVMGQVVSNKLNV